MYYGHHEAEFGMSWCAGERRDAPAASSLGCALPGGAGTPLHSPAAVPPACPRAGFSQAFWQAYHQVIPRAPGWEDRHKLYTLYHYLNHYVLFGGGYHGNCQRLLVDLVDVVEQKDKERS